MDFVDVAYAYALAVKCGGETHCAYQVLRSTDGARTWHPRAEPLRLLSTSSGVDLDFGSRSDGWLAIDHQLFRTTNGGLTWTLDATPGDPDQVEAGPDYVFANFETCRESECSTRLFKRAPLTAPWTDVHVPMPGDLNAFDAQTILVSGGLIQRSTNGGMSWETTPRPCSGGVWGESLAALDVDRLWFTCIGEMGACRGAMVTYRTVDGGIRWVPWADSGWGAVDVPGDHGTHAPRGTYRVILDGGQRILAGNTCGGDATGGLYLSVDEGRTWEPSLADAGGATFVDDRNGWAVGCGVLHRTTDGGSTWEALAGTRDTSDPRCH